MEKDSINFYVPTLDGRTFNPSIEMVKYMNMFPDRFRENVRIHSMYGAFPGTVWNGGRANFGVMPSEEVIKGTLLTANDLGVALRYTYTNNHISEDMLKDTYCNQTMKMANNGLNEVLVNSPILEKYIRDTYKNFKISLSTTACIRDIDAINDATKKYDLVVLDYRDNKNFDFLEKIEDKDRIEILLDESCPKECPYRKQHYDEIARVQVYQLNSEDAKCKLAEHKPTSFYECLERNKDTVITASELYDKYIKLGFRHFKLLGRNTEIFYQFESYIHYFVKPEWQNKVRYDWYYLFFQNSIQ